MIKRWAVFAGDNYYPSGGMGDFRASFDTKEEAKDFSKDLRWEWIEIYDMEEYK